MLSLPGPRNIDCVITPILTIDWILGLCSYMVFMQIFGSERFTQLSGFVDKKKKIVNWVLG